MIIFDKRISNAETKFIPSSTLTTQQTRDKLSSSFKEHIKLKKTQEENEPKINLSKSNQKFLQSLGFQLKLTKEEEENE